MTISLTKTQLDLMRVIQELQDAGESVTYRRMGLEMDLHSLSGITRILTGLIERGYLRRRWEGRKLHLDILQRVEMPQEFRFLPMIKVPAWLLETPVIGDAA